MDSIRENLLALIEAIEDCFEKRRLMPCLVLLYCGVDVVAGLDRTHGESTKDSFIRWAGEYLCKANALPCTALELYAARCGILHGFTAESNLSRQGRVRKVHYAWGSASPEDLTAASKLLGHEDFVAVKIDHLVQVFRRAVADYVGELSQHPERWAMATLTSQGWFTHVDQNVVAGLVRKRQDKSQSPL